MLFGLKAGASLRLKGTRPQLAGTSKPEAEASRSRKELRAGHLIAGLLHRTEYIVIMLEVETK